MINISKYRLEVNKKGTRYVISLEIVPCPLCHGVLKLKDFRLRIVRWADENTEFIIIRVLYCEQCDRSHRELPDFLTPNKHYAAEVIEAAIDDDKTVGCPAETSTVNRWRAWFERIKGYLAAAVLAAYSAFEKARLSDLNPLIVLRKSGRGWLPGGMRRYVNSGGGLSEIT
jgi:uncharacterized protein YbaR (Trm112 family)